MSDFSELYPGLYKCFLSCKNPVHIYRYFSDDQPGLILISDLGSLALANPLYTSRWRFVLRVSWFVFSPQPEQELDTKAARGTLRKPTDGRRGTTDGLRRTYSEDSSLRWGTFEENKQSRLVGFPFSFLNIRISINQKKKEFEVLKMMNIIQDVVL